MLELPMDGYVTNYYLLTGTGGGTLRSTFGEKHKAIMIYTVTINPALDRTHVVPQLTMNQVLRANKVMVDWGGKGFNVSRALKELGLESTAIGFAGGPTGQKLYSGLQSAGINAQFIWISDETRINFSVFSSNTGDSIKVNEPGPVISQQEQTQLTNLIENKVNPGDVWVLSGSLAPNIPKNFYSHLIEIIQVRGAKAILDTSGPSLLAGIESQPYLVKPNLEELESVIGKKLENRFEIKTASQPFINKGIGWVAVSCGALGLILTNREGTWHAPAPQIKPMNTTGAGDALVAGMVWAITNQCQPNEIAAWGVAAGSAAASTEGVNFGSMNLVSNLYASIKGFVQEI